LRLIKALSGMNASRLAKIETQLAASEDSLRAQLVVVLPRVSTSGEALFFNSQHMPQDHSPNWLPPESEVLFALALECIELHEQLSLPSTGSLAAAFLAACSEASETSNPHRRGPRQLAASLLTKVSGSAA
jgi:hypothetical protein